MDNNGKLRRTKIHLVNLKLSNENYDWIAKFKKFSRKIWVKSY